MGKNTIAVIIATLIVATLGLSSLGGEWVLGTFWKWKATGAQSRSVTSTVTIYVLTATTVLDAQVYVLGQVNQIEDATFVTLGEAMREPGYPIQAFGVSFQNDAEWRLNPPGWESRESSSWPVGGTAGSRTIVRKVETNEASVSVLAGEYTCCSKLVISNHGVYPDGTVDQQKTIWYSHDLDWPVKINDTGTFQGTPYTRTTTLVETGRMRPADAVAQIIAAIDEMEEQRDIPASAIGTIRWKLLSLGILKQP